MNWRCPIDHRTWNQQVAGTVRQVQDGSRDYASLDRKYRIEQYAIFAVLIDEFYKTYHNDLGNWFEACYEPWLSRDRYISKIRQYLAQIIENVEYMKNYDINWIGINNWIGTMCFVLKWVFTHNPDIHQDECKSICREWMKKLHANKLPPKGEKVDITFSNYSELVSRLLDKTLDKWDETKLSCPALYTQWWNNLFEAIIDAVYEKFPVVQNDDTSWESYRQKYQVASSV